LLCQKERAESSGGRERKKNVGHGKKQRKNLEKEM
jgi:hypothetical protein